MRNAPQLGLAARLLPRKTPDAEFPPDKLHPASEWPAVLADTGLVHALSIEAMLFADIHCLVVVVRAWAWWVLPILAKKPSTRQTLYQEPRSVLF